MTEATIERPTTPTQGEWTYADYLALPDDGTRYEIIEGVLYVVNAPSSDHQTAVTEVSAELRNFVKRQQLGRVLIAPFEVHLSSRSRPVQPDVLFIRAERWPDESISYYEGSPDLVVEVISPSSVRMDRVVKFTAYEAAGVPEYWIINPHTRTIEVFTLSSGEYALLGEYTGDEVVQSAVLAGIELVASALFL
ncbi:MAG: Uma2 family endonuclease [Caldilineaceae bacterium]|nr:Uma2 family endonuclease [Caldilineaceae bacterium]